jgi:hypothetical protein
MFISKKHLSRRTFLRGTFGAAVALPLLDAMVPAMTAQSRTAAAPQIRFGGAYIPNGVLPERWHPATVGRNFEFTSVMKPLEPFREQLITISGMVGSGTPGPHLGASAGWLNGVGAVGRQGEPILSGKTLDQYIAEKIGQDTPLPSIEVGTEDMGTSIGACDGYACVYFNSLAFKTDTSPLPIEVNPRVTFERMFGETGSTSQRLNRLQYKNSMLDSLTQEVARLRGELGPRDQVLLGDYLDNVREVERRIQQVMRRSDLNVEIPAAPSGVPESLDEHVALTYDLMHLAFQGDISRVFTFLLANEASNRGYSFIGVPESHHVCSHHGGNPEAMDKYTTIVTWHVTQFANFLKKLADTADGDGSLLDHSLVMWGSGMSNGNAHDRFSPPTILAGGANGWMKDHGNQHVAVPNRAPSANVLLNVADVFDIPLEKIGPSTGRLAL